MDDAVPFGAPASTSHRSESPVEWSVDLFDGLELNRTISAAVSSGRDQVAVTANYSPDGLIVLAESLQDYLENWSELLERGMDQRRGYWGFDAGLDRAEIDLFISRVGF